MPSKRKEDVDLVARAYAFSENAHHGHMRYSGDPYFLHVSAVGYSLAKKRIHDETLSGMVEYHFLTAAANHRCLH